jgi:hypothetical protein
MRFKLVLFSETLIANVAVKMRPSFQLAERTSTRLLLGFWAELRMSCHGQNLGQVPGSN